MRIRVATWNLQWAQASSARGRRAMAAVRAVEPDVVVLTEATLDLLDGDGYVVDAGTGWGYPLRREDRRKVLLWSARPWRDVDDVGSAELPGGRWVAATTDTEIGPVRVVGVCIPWDGAHVANGRRDRTRWEDHGAYLDAMRTLIPVQARPVVVAGDFNQRIPRTRQPKAMAAALAEALGDLVVATAGATDHGPLIDHVAHSPDLSAGGPMVLPDRDEHGPLSDHTGVVVDLTPSHETVPVSHATVVSG